MRDLIHPGIVCQGVSQAWLSIPGGLIKPLCSVHPQRVFLNLYLWIGFSPCVFCVFLYATADGPETVILEMYWSVFSSRSYGMGEDLLLPLFNSGWDLNNFLYCILVSPLLK